MASSKDKNGAARYLLDPLNAPEPNQETGPGTHFRNTTTEKARTPSTSTSGYPTPPGSASPTQSTFSSRNPYAHRQKAFAEYADGRSAPKVVEETGDIKGKGRRRGSSLTEKFPGDMSHRPLDQLKKETKAANRAPHLRKKHIPGADIIDSLDTAIVGGSYHHSGPYDATLFARNSSFKSSPLMALKDSNEEALRATPADNIKDSLDKHVPLQGTAVIPPGFKDLSGRTMQYEEGADLMREEDAPGGAYKRIEGVKYLPEDLKGKGEPSFSIERAIKERKASSHRRVLSDGDSAYEMQPRSSTGRPSSASRLRSHDGIAAASGSSLSPKSAERSTRFEEIDGGAPSRSHSTGGKIGEGLKKRFGSLRRSKKTLEN